MDRISYIEKQFNKTFKGIAAPLKASADAWWSWTDRDIHFPFGFKAPELLRDEGYYVVSFCPEIISESTSKQSDARFRIYVETVVHHLTLHIALLMPKSGVDTENIETAIDSAIYETMPEGLAVMNDVQFSYLDKTRGR